MTRFLRFVAPLTLALAASGAPAHDTWFAPLAGGALTLATGNRFPTGEQGVDVKYFTQHGCRSGSGRVVPLGLLRHTPTGTQLRAAVDPRGGSCFVQITPFEVDLPADRIQVYFDEIRPGPAVLQAWEALRARGLPFIERYTKSARIDFGPPGPPSAVGTAMDVLREGPSTFQLLREGRPLAGQSLELVPERGAGSQWHRTDAQGRIRPTLMVPGRWLLRGTDLQLSSSDPTRWESLFITYSFEVSP